MPRRVTILAFVLIASVLLGVGAPAWAHPGAPLLEDPPAPSEASVVVQPSAVSPTPAPPAAANAPGAPWLALLAALAALSVARRPRRALVLALVVLLAVFAFEGGVHSVHHQLDPGTGPAKSADCQVAAAAQQLTAAAVDLGSLLDLPLPVARMVVGAGPSAPAVRFLLPDSGRAPPPHTV
jgi:hypothetical protein